MSSSHWPIYNKLYPASNNPTQEPGTDAGGYNGWKRVSASEVCAGRQG